MRLININISLNPDSYQVPAKSSAITHFRTSIIKGFWYTGSVELSKFPTTGMHYRRSTRIFRCRLLSPYPLRSRFRWIRLVEFHYRTSTTVKLVPRDFANYGNQGGSDKSRGYSRFLLSRVLLVPSSPAQLLDEATSSNCISRLI